MSQTQTLFLNSFCCYLFIVWLFSKKMLFIIYMCVTYSKNTQMHEFCAHSRANCVHQHAKMQIFAKICSIECFWCATLYNHYNWWFSLCTIQVSFVVLYDIKGPWWFSNWCEIITGLQFWWSRRGFSFSKVEYDWCSVQRRVFVQKVKLYKREV